jgi:hypothetical protein
LLGVAVVESDGLLWLRVLLLAELEGVLWGGTGEGDLRRLGKWDDVVGGGQGGV